MRLEQPSVQRYLNSVSMQKTLRNANEKMMWKPYVVRYAPLKTVLGIFGIIAPLLSIAFASSFVASWFSFAHVYVAFLIAIILLVGLEYLKAYVINNGFEMYYGNTGAPWANFGLGLVLFVGSFITSYNGAETFIIQVDKNQSIIENNYQSKKDSVINYYNAIGQGYEKEHQRLIAVAEKQYLGSNTPEQQKTISTLLAAKAANAEAMNAAIEKLEAKEASEVKTNKTEVLTDAWYTKLLSAIIELLILGTIWYPHFFAFMAVLEGRRLGLLSDDSKDEFVRSLIVTDTNEPKSITAGTTTGTGTQETPPTTQTDTQIAPAAQSSPTTTPTVPTTNPGRRSIGFNSEENAETSGRPSGRLIDYDKLYIVNEMKNILGTPLTIEKIETHGKNQLIREIVEKHPNGYTSKSTFFSVFSLVETFIDEINELKA